MANINSDPRYIEWVKELHRKVFEEKEVLDVIKYFNFTHIDRKEGVDETDIK